MKSTPFIITAATLVASAVAMAAIAWVAFINSYYWADRYKSSDEIPETVQAILTLTDSAFWLGLLILVVHVIGFVALYMHRKQLKKAELESDANP